MADWKRGRINFIFLGQNQSTPLKPLFSCTLFVFQVLAFFLLLSPSSSRVRLIFVILRWKTVGFPARKRGIRCATRINFPRQHKACYFIEKYANTVRTYHCKYCMFSFSNQIWDMQKKACVYILEGFISGVISVVSRPILPVLITSTGDCLIHLWSATNFR